MKYILHFAQYSAPYKGNFIRSLVALETKLTTLGYHMAYVFPAAVESQPWWSSFSSEHVTFTITANESKQTAEGVCRIINEVKPLIIHTHFEGFDKIVTKAVNAVNSDCRVVWHLHDFFSYHPNLIKHIYQYYCFFNHYFLHAQHVSVIGVSPQILSFVKRYRELLGGRFIREEVIPNGVDFSRIRQQEKQVHHNEFTFLAYGGRNSQKRIDLLLRAAQELKQFHGFRILITRGVDTQYVCESFFHGLIPDWCQLIDQTDDINSILEQADCFVSTSVHETFSYAICEATFFGLPIIQSDIDGTRWNANNPSTFVFRSEDSNDLKRAMLEVISSDRQLLQDSIKQTRYNNLQFSIDNWCERIISFYEKIIPLH